MIRTIVASLTALRDADRRRRTSITASRRGAFANSIADLVAQDPVVRARAACEMREAGDTAVDAIQPLASMLGDAAPVEAQVCSRNWWRGNPNDLTSPGEQAAAALVAIGTRAFQPVLGALRSTTWTARRNAAWALGAFDDQRAVDALVDALKDREPGVRETGGVGARRASTTSAPYRHSSVP